MLNYSFFEKKYPHKSGKRKGFDTKYYYLLLQREIYEEEIITLYTNEMISSRKN